MIKKIRFKTKEFGFKVTEEAEVDSEGFKELKANPNVKLLCFI